MIRKISVLFVLGGAFALFPTGAEELAVHEECSTAESVATTAAAGISLRECVENYNDCLDDCAVNCEETPFPDLCYAICSTQCELGLGACVGVVIVIRIL